MKLHGPNWRLDLTEADLRALRIALELIRLVTAGDLRRAEREYWTQAKEGALADQFDALAEALAEPEQ